MSSICENAIVVQGSDSLWKRSLLCSDGDQVLATRMMDWGAGCCFVLMVTKEIIWLYGYKNNAGNSISRFVCNQQVHSQVYGASD